MSDAKIPDDQSADEKVINQAMDELIEQFDTVQIFITRHDGDGTVARIRGRGNYYARRGIVQDWLEDETSASRAAAYKEIEGD